MSVFCQTPKTPPEHKERGPEETTWVQEEGGGMSLKSPLNASGAQCTTLDFQLDFFFYTTEKFLGAFP